MNVRMNWHRLSAAALGIAVLALAACSATPAQQDAAAQRSATLERGPLEAMVSATGSIKPGSETSLSFEAPGTISEVNVKVGDSVKAGDAIARLDTSDLELSLVDAETAEIIATANYSRTVQGAREADIKAAEAALRAAQASYSKLAKGPAPTDYADAEAALRNAEAALAQAQNAYDKEFANNPETITASPQAVQLEAATNAFNAAKARFDRASKGADRADLAAAAGQIESAKATLARLKEPARQYDIDQAQAQIDQARIQVEQARRRIEQSTLRAPKDGVISTLNMKVGEAAGGQPVAALVDTNDLVVDITVDEIDVAKISPGQEVLLTLDALPDVEITGTVERIAPTSTTVNGVVSYEVRVSLDPTDQPLRAGMTANTSIVLDRREDALLAPNWAIRRDRQNGKAYLLIKTGETASQEVEVKTGLRNDTFSEILSGASEGQIVLAPQAPTLLGQ
jgi:HlyD family secretion protein